MSSKQVVFKSDQVRQLHNKLLELSEETNLLRQRLNGQANSWSTELPIWGSVHQAQREINRLTEDAEKLAEVVRKAMQGVEKVQQENQRGAEKWAQQAMSLTHLLGKYQQQAVNRYVEVAGSMWKAANHLVERIAQMFRRDELNDDPTVKQLQQLIRTEGLPDGLRIQSEQKLQAIFDARNMIAKSQVAYEVYKRYGNKKLMEQAHKQAEASRERLKAMGIQLQQFESGKDLTHHFKQSDVMACAYDPLYNQKVELLNNEQYRVLMTLAMGEGPKAKWAYSQLQGIKQVREEMSQTSTSLLRT